MAQNEVLRSAFWKSRLSSGSKPQPQCAFAEHTNACLFLPSPQVSIGQRGSGLPLPPWALLLCWWSPELGSHSKRDLLRGEAGVGTKIPSERMPVQSSTRQLGNSGPRAHLTHGSKLYSGRCILEMYTLLVEQNTAPMRLCSAKQRLPFSPLALWSP